MHPARSVWPGIGAMGVVLFLAAACGGGDASAPQLGDPAGLRSDLSAVDLSANTPQFTSFAALNTGFNWAGLAPGLSAARTLLQATLPNVTRGREPAYLAQASRAVALRNLSSTLKRTAGPLGVTIPPSALGTTYEWDEANDQYFAGSRTGAPANGIRIILYSVNPLSGTIVEPAQEIGYADIVDNGTANSYGLTVTVVGTDQVTYADYTVSATFTPDVVSPTLITAAADGFVTNGTNRLDFTATASADLVTNSVHFNITRFELNNPDVQFTLDLDVLFGTVPSNTVNIVFDFAISSRGQTVGADGTIALNTVTQDASAAAQVTVNGETFATIQGNTTSLLITGPGGRALTGAELAAVRDLFDAPGKVVGVLAAITGPAFGALGINDDFDTLNL